MENQDLHRLQVLAGLPAGAPPMRQEEIRLVEQPNFLRELNESAARAPRKRSSSINEVSPPGFKGTVKAMKKHKDIDNPYALGWYEKNQGDKSHYKADGKKKKESVKEAAMRPGQIMRVSDGSGIDSGRKVMVITPQEFAQGEKIEGWYESPVVRGWVPIRMPDGKVSKMPHNRLQPVAPNPAVHESDAALPSKAKFPGYTVAELKERAKNKEVGSKMKTDLEAEIKRREAK